MYKGEVMGSENVFEMFLNGISSFKGVAVDRDQFLYSTFKNILRRIYNLLFL